MVRNRPRKLRLITAKILSINSIGKRRKQFFTDKKKEIIFNTSVNRLSDRISTIQITAGQNQAEESEYNAQRNTAHPAYTQTADLQSPNRTSVHASRPNRRSNGQLLENNRLHTWKPKSSSKAPEHQARAPNTQVQTPRATQPRGKNAGPHGKNSALETNRGVDEDLYFVSQARESLPSDFVHLTKLDLLKWETIQNYRKTILSLSRKLNSGSAEPLAQQIEKSTEQLSIHKHILSMETKARQKFSRRIESIGKSGDAVREANSQKNTGSTTRCSPTTRSSPKAPTRSSLWRSRSSKRRSRLCKSTGKRPKWTRTWRSTESTAE